MGHAILYCSGCSKQLREPDFDRGAAFRYDGRVFCSACAPAEARAQAPPSPKPDLPSTGTGKISKIAPPPPTGRHNAPDDPAAATNNKVPLIIGGSMVAVALLVALFFSGKESPHPAHNPPPPPPPVVQQRQEPTPPTPRERPLLPPVTTDKEAEEVIRKAREYAKANPDDLPEQLALYEAAVRASALTGHAAAVVRERDAVQARVKAIVKKRLEALDASVKEAADREEFGPALKLVEDARAQGLGTDWIAEVDQRSQALQDNANKLFVAVRAEAVEAQRRGADQDVRRLSDRVEKWGMPLLKSELAKAVASASKKPPPPPVAKPLEAYRKIWAEAMGAASFRDFPGALKKIEEVAAASHDGAVKAESASDLELFKLAIANEDEALQLLARMPKGQKTTLTFMTEAGKNEMTGTVTRNENHEIELAGEKGTVRIPLGEICARSLGQIVREKRTDKGAPVLCVIDSDVPAARSFVEGGPAIPDKYWTWKPPANNATQMAARRLFYSAERDLRSHPQVAEALQKYATLLKDHATTEFVRRNKALIALRSEPAREFYFTFEDIRIGGAIRGAKGEKDEPQWRAVADAKAAENFVELGFYALAETEYRCWIYVGGCCAEVASATVQLLEGEEPLGEPAPLKTPAMPFKTHEAHAGRGRPVTKWGWAQVTLPKFARAGLKRVRVSAALKGFSASEAFVTATRPGLPTATDLRELERVRLEIRGRADPSLVGHWKMSDLVGTTAFDSGPYAANGQLVKGASWTSGTVSPWSPPALKLDGTGYVNLGTQLPMLQHVAGCTLSAWICPEALAPEGSANVIVGLSRNNGTTVTADSRASITLSSAGSLTAGFRTGDKAAMQALKAVEKVKVGTWIHVATTADFTTNTVVVYINATPQQTTGTATFPQKSTPNTPSTGGVIGMEEDMTKYAFKGGIADVRIYSRALTREEIAELMGSH